MFKWSAQQKSLGTTALKAQCDVTNLLSMADVSKDSEDSLLNTE